MSRLLVSAYACEPGKGSEPGVGWHWVTQLATAYSLCVITRSNNRRVIEAGLPRHLVGRIRFVYYDVPRWAGWFKRGTRGMYPYYVLWQWGAYRVAKALVYSEHFDLCVHLTFGSLWLPTFMHRLPVPFVWGPVGGGEVVPPAFLHALPWRARVVEQVRHMLVSTAAVNPVAAPQARAASLVIARTADTGAVLRRLLRRSCPVMLETGATADLLASRRGGSRTSGVRILCCGRLVAKKNSSMAIRAMAMVRRTHPDARMTIAGDGPLRGRLEDEMRRLGLARRVCFLGHISRSRIFRLLRESHIFVFPSLGEGGPWALVEAMAAGLPVVCTHAGGAGLLTDARSAIRIPLTTPEQTTKRLAAAIRRLADSPGLRDRLGRRAQERIRRRFLWPVLRPRMVSLIATALRRAAGAGA